MMSYIEALEAACDIDAGAITDYIYDDDFTDFGYVALLSRIYEQPKEKVAADFRLYLHPQMYADKST